MDKNGNMLENDEGVFAAKIVRDTDTRGGLKFTNKQSELIGSVSKNIAELMPDIGHFTKSISN